MMRDEVGWQSAAQRARFATTQWSLVVAAGDRRHEAAGAALESLCRRYWYPVYAFVRRWGCSAADAQDHTQEFFATLLEKDYLQSADRERGRFRTFLLTAVSRFLSKQAERACAQKRGGGQKLLSIDFAMAEGRYQLEPIDRCTPEVLFERRWALTLLDAVIEKLEADYQRKGKSELFRQLKPFLISPGLETDYVILATELKMTAGAVKVAIHRLRRRFVKVVTEEIAATVADPDEIDDEIGRLLAAVRAPV